MEQLFPDRRQEKKEKKYKKIIYKQFIIKRFKIRVYLTLGRTTVITAIMQ